ncbi:hypothetical protein IFM89_030298 [Coptis chinensis]|uniref:DUF241 domain protein n=1 Tax=Coptis chinensis TaxID=261450 RepID=A0A835MFV5_9MAGN|nr:hypothetical protein IFM89_030298 [Coptis chinensis]
MTSSPLNTKTCYHVRSISLPSRSHPLTLDIEEQLCRLRSSRATCSSSTGHNLNVLNGLFESVEDLLQLPLTRHALSIDRSNTSVNNVLDGSVRLLDICSVTKDVFSQMKECLQDLQSSLRRNRGGEHGLQNEVGAYMIARKKVHKLIQKCLGDFKKAENKHEKSALLDKDYNLVAILSVFREVESITHSMFKSLLLSVSSSRTNTNGWSVVSKLMHTKRVACQGEEADLFELEKVDAALLTLVSKKSSKGIEVVNVKNVHTKLAEVQLSMQGLEDQLESIYKSLIKTRVTLLNILSQ